MTVDTIATASRHECAAILAAVAARLTALEQEQIEQTNERGLKVSAAAELMGISVQTMYHLLHTRLAYMKINTGTKRVLVSNARLMHYLKHDGVDAVLTREAK
jgi:DNA-directed RNA polymerase specialized sigma24 family protein